MNKANTKRGWLGIKIDFSKAFDCIEWNFIQMILERLGFHNKFIGWIMQCITTPIFSILVNGSPHGYFTAQRGLRQGDVTLPLYYINGNPLKDVVQS